MSLFTLATATKLAVASYYDDNGISLPARRYVSAGRPAFDCELFCVSVQNVASHSGDIRVDVIESMTTSAGFMLRYARLVLWVVRCGAVINDNGDPPTVTAEEAAAQPVLSDEENMRAAILAAVRSGALDGCADVAFEQWQNFDTEGGLAASAMSLRMNLAGW